MDQHAGHPRRWATLGVLIVCLLVVVLDNTILNVALKTIQEDLDASQSQLEWAVNSYTLIFAGLMFTAGVLGDRYGRRLFLIIGLLVFGAASAASAFVDTPAQLITTRALMGIGAAMVQPQTLSIITNVFGPKERGKAIGIWAGFSGLAIAIGPITGGFLLEHFWWGSVFLVNVPFVIVGSVAALMIVPESRDPKPRRLDPFGVVLSIVGISTLVYGIIHGGETGNWTTPGVLGPIVGGLALIAVFVWMEKRSTHPALDVTLFKNPAFSAGTVTLAVVFFAMMGLTFSSAFYLQAIRDYSPLEAGAWLLPVAVAILLTAPQSSKLVARFGSRAVISTGMFIAGLGMGGYYFLDSDSPMWLFAVTIFVMGLGMGNVMAPATESIMSAVPRDKAGAGSAVNNTVRMIAGALGVAILGSVLSTTYRSNVEPDLKVLPEGSRHDAGESIGDTFQAVAQVAKSVAQGKTPPEALNGLDILARSANDAFIAGMHNVAICSVIIAWAGAILAAIFMPGKKSAAPVSEDKPQIAEKVAA
ncbi:MAG: MFS transporter [Corynebacteriales bacterium]|nr:MFS transporter [Mycobacteriales bacterium]